MIHHDHAIGTVLIVVVFLATTLIDGSPRNHERTLLYKGHPASNQKIQSQHPPLSQSQEDRFSTWYTVPDDVYDLEAQSSEIRSHTIPYPRNQDVESGGPRKKGKNCRPCATVLVEKHPRLCAIVKEVIEFEKTVPHISQVVQRRMGGGSRMDFKWKINTEQSASMLLFEAVQHLTIGLRKFYEFLGMVESDFDSILQNTETPNITGWMEQPLNHIKGGPKDARRSKQKEDSSGSCESLLTEVGIDACDFLIVLDRLDIVLDELPGIKAQQEDKVKGAEVVAPSELIVKLQSDDLTLNAFLNALRSSILDTVEITILEVDPKLLDPKFGDILENRDGQGRRHLINENDEEVTAVFETPDVRIEIVDAVEDFKSSESVSDELGNLDDEKSEVSEVPQTRRFIHSWMKSRRQGLNRPARRMFREKFSVHGE